MVLRIWLPDRPGALGLVASRIGALGDEGNLFFGLGYCGEGVVMSQVAGTILAAMLAGDGGAFAALPFVGGVPPWVGFEPFRAIGVRAVEAALRALAGEA